MSNVKYDNYYATPDPAPITPDVLTELLNVDRPAGTILIQGIAKDIRSYPGCVYGRLVLGTSSVRFRTPEEFAPSEGEAVTIKGTLKIKNANRSGEDWRATHEVTLYGKVVGNWEPRESVNSVTQLPNRDERTLLEKFILDNNVASLAVLVSGTARADIISSLQSADRSERPEFIETNFGNKEKFLAELRKLRNRHDITGLSIARGGGGGQEIIGGSPEIIREMIDMEKPFYVALGHATDFALIDKHADQSFHTPSAFGSAIAQALSSASERIEQEYERDNLKRQNRELRGRIETMERNQLRYSSRLRLICWTIAVILILSICGWLWAFA